MAAIIPLTLVFPADLSGRHRHRRAVEELGLHEELEAGCFLTGHPEVKVPVEQAALGFSAERVYLFGTGAAPVGSVGYASIVSVSVEGHSDILARFSEPRLMFLGNRLLAFRWRESSDGSYVVVEWEDADGQHHEGIFCFEGLAADLRARRLRDAILHHAALHRRTGIKILHQAFRCLLDEFEVRRCEHCSRVHRDAARRRDRFAA